MTPDLIRGWLRLHLDQMHNTLETIGLNVKQLDDDEAERSLRIFKYRVRAAIRLFRYDLKIEYTKPIRQDEDDAETR